MEKRPLPTSLVVVAVLFIIVGALCLVDVLVSLMRGHIHITLGVLGLLIGPGLLRLRRGWRTCAIVFIWIGLIVTTILA